MARDRVSTQILVTRHKVGYHGCYFVILPDHAAGLPHRYTVWRLGSSPRVGKGGGAVVVGRELDLPCAKKLLKRLSEEAIAKGQKLLARDLKARAANEAYFEKHGYYEWDQPPVQVKNSEIARKVNEQ